VNQLDKISVRTWILLATQLAGKVGDAGSPTNDNGFSISTELCNIYHGADWQILPTRFGEADVQCKQCRRWRQTSAWKRLFEAVQPPDLDWVLLDSVIVWAHAQAADSLKKPHQQ
jgi:hypothetical protein